jgi:sigma-54 dependent transcriptional regulator, acetoin dehydrogenase operon transcriptional activator AcoR
VVRRVGGKDFIRVDVRLVCATNKDLLQECRQGNFREDLYYRLNVINIRMPALRERKEDIPELVEHFLEALGRQTGVVRRIDPTALRRMVEYDWPGNIRELQNEVKRLHAFAEDTIRTTDLSETILQGKGREFLHPGLEKELADLTLHEATEKLEKELIRMALIAAKGNKSLVAKKLEIPKTSLYNKINKYQLDKEFND